MPRRGAGRYFFALNRRSPSPADGPRARSRRARARAETARTTPEGPGACDRPRLSAFAAPSLGFLERAFSVAPHDTPPFARPPPPPSTSVLIRVPSSTAPAPPPTAEMKKWKAVTMLAVPACGGLGVYLFAGMGHHEHHEQPVRAPTPTDPPIPPLRSSRRTLRPRTRAEDERSLTRPRFAPPPLLHSSGVLVHAQATQAASPGAATAPCSSTASARRTERAAVATRRLLLLTSSAFAGAASFRHARAPFRGPFDYTCPTRSRALALR